MSVCHALSVKTKELWNVCSFKRQVTMGLCFAKKTENRKKGAFRLGSPTKKAISNQIYNFPELYTASG
jgi:hypothetical protein